MRRGQAMAEMVVGLTVLVTVIIFGIHFAEVGFLSLKVQEAANFALWDATGHQTHSAALQQWNQYPTAIASANAEAQARYQGFDGRTSKKAALATPMTQVFTQVVPVGGQLIQVKCAPHATAGTAPLLGMPPTPMVTTVLGGSVHVNPAIAAPNGGDTGIGCTASASITGFGIPRAFLDRTNGKGFFTSANWTPLVIPVCAAGLAINGSCANAGSFALLLDDWGLSGTEGNPGSESGNCAVLDQGNCANPGYYRTVQGVYATVTPGGAGTALASYVRASPGIDEAKFWMSFQGSDGTYGAFTDSIGVEHLNQILWETTPFSQPATYATAYSSRSECFLGMPCP